MIIFDIYEVDDSLNAFSKHINKLQGLLSEFDNESSGDSDNENLD